MEREQIAVLKKKEILEKLKTAERIADKEGISSKLMKELETDFDPDAY
eukprot:CAMPEP_0168353060 /NCGR_PEP_ID=MMETSP0213-20121227/23000_1 /TAXON_ID=151035 /ORGANISM="Euplotes harpa, Strain FSP1.4" /LENGTH=47 /DNA_ID= /DNA_START= /DNA_END= /DNA_ORIENTATION=